jgi:hypothetical protein
MKSYGHHPEMRNLFQIHQDINTTSLQLISIYQRGQIDQAHQDLQLLENKSVQFLEILFRLDQKLAN